MVFYEVNELDWRQFGAQVLQASNLRFFALEVESVSLFISHFCLKISHIPEINVRQLRALLFFYAGSMYVDECNAFFYGFIGPRYRCQINLFAFHKKGFHQVWYRVYKGSQSHRSTRMIGAYGKYLSFVNSSKGSPLVEVFVATLTRHPP